jgi:hypothetical protein
MRKIRIGLMGGKGILKRIDNVKEYYNKFIKNSGKSSFIQAFGPERSPALCISFLPLSTFFDLFLLLESPPFAPLLDLLFSFLLPGGDLDLNFFLGSLGFLKGRGSGKSYRATLPRLNLFSRAGVFLNFVLLGDFCLKWVTN